MVSAAGGGGGGGGFPGALFTIEDDPAAVRDSVAGYRTFARQAESAGAALQATSVPSWVGSDGDLFRSRRTQYEPMMTTAESAFSGLVTWVADFADRLTTLRASMSTLRARAEQVWAQLQAAIAAEAAAAAQVAGAASAVGLSAGNPVVAAQAATTLATAGSALDAATTQVVALQSQWEECVRQAEKLHADLRATAGETAAALGGLPRPPAVPAPAVGGASPVSLTVPGGPPLPTSTLGDPGGPGAPGAPDAPTPADLLQGFHTVLQAPLPQTLLSLGTIYTGLSALPNAGFLFAPPARGAAPTVEGLAKAFSLERGSQLTGSAASLARSSEALKQEFTSLRDLGRPLTAEEAARLMDLAGVPGVPGTGAARLEQPAAEAAAAAATAEKWGPRIRGLNRGLMGLSAIGDVDTLISPLDEGTAGTVDRVAAAGNLVGLGIGAAGEMGLLGGATLIPGVGEAVVVGTGAYLAGNWLYHNTDTFKHGWDSTWDAGEKVMHGDFSGAKESLEQGISHLGEDIGNDAHHVADAVSNAWSTVTGWL